MGAGAIERKRTQSLRRRSALLWPCLDRAPSRFLAPGQAEKESRGWNEHTDAGLPKREFPGQRLHDGFDLVFASRGIRATFTGGRILPSVRRSRSRVGLLPLSS